MESTFVCNRDRNLEGHRARADHLKQRQFRRQLEGLLKISGHALTNKAETGATFFANGQMKTVVSSWADEFILFQSHLVGLHLSDHSLRGEIRMQLELHALDRAREGRHAPAADEDAPLVALL